MQMFLYLQQHRKCLYQGISCVFLFVFFGLLIQMLTLPVSSFVFKSRLLFGGITAALSMTLWNYTKRIHYCLHLLYRNFSIFGIRTDACRTAC